MSTLKQIAANRANSQKSTGPRTPEGKAAASRNALKTGIYASGTIIRHESSQMLEELEAQYSAEYQPLTPTERTLVDALVHMDWLLRRYRWVETETWWATIPRLTDDQTRSNCAGHVFIAEPTISRIHRLRNSTLKQYRETVAELRALQATRPDDLPEFQPVYYPWDHRDDPEPEPEPVETKTTSPEIGFVSSNNGGASLQACHAGSPAGGPSPAPDAPPPDSEAPAVPPAPEPPARPKPIASAHSIRRGNPPNRRELP